MDDTYSENIAREINNFLKDDNWNFSFDDKLGQFEFNMDIRGRIKKVE